MAQKLIDRFDALELDSDDVLFGQEETDQNIQSRSTSSPVKSDQSAHDIVCAICLDGIPLEDIATVKGCEHVYCVNCILQWTTFNDNATCPQCKAGFSYLYVYRQLDGTLTDFPMEESVVLLKRACWFQDFVKSKEKGKSVVGGAPPRLNVENWAEFYDEEEDDEDEEGELEDFYFSNAAGRARIVLGNRRLGENGYLRSGRVYARPVAITSPGDLLSQKIKGKLGSSPNCHGGQLLRKKAGQPVLGSSPPTPVAAAPARVPAECGSSGSASKGQGRRARRAARRAAAHAEDDD